jgi:hypothetical protein
MPSFKSFQSFKPFDPLPSSPSVHPELVEGRGGGKSVLSRVEGRWGLERFKRLELFERFELFEQSFRCPLFFLI